MQTRVTNKTARYHFDSLRALSEYNATTRRVWTTDEAEYASAYHSWDLNAGYNGALTLARTGWLEGAQKAQKALKAFAPATPTPQTRVDVAGYRPDMALYSAGAPAHMIRRATDAEAGRSRVLTLVVSVVANCSTDAQAMANFGVAVAQYVNQLERSGTRVHLLGSFAVTRDKWRLACNWTVKRADQPLDLAVLAFTIGHPAMLRRIGLAFMERQSDTPQLSGYGSAVDTLATDLIDAPRGAVILNGMKDASRHAATPEAALEYVTAQIDEARKTQWSH